MSKNEDDARRDESAAAEGAEQESVELCDEELEGAAGGAATDLTAARRTSAVGLLLPAVQSAGESLRTSKPAPAPT